MPTVPRWSSESFLVYAGGLIVLTAAVEALDTLAGSYGKAGFAGWAALVFGGLAAFAFGFKQAGEWLAAGVFAASTVVAWTILVGALESWFGWLPEDVSPLRGFHVSVLAIALLGFAAAVVALRVFRFPLLVALAAFASGFFVTDLISNGGNWSAVVTLFVGLAFFVAALVVERGPSRPYGFWLHVAAGVTVGGALLWFWHESDADWALVAVAGIVYVALAVPTRRSSYAVLGAYGLYLSATYFAETWSGNEGAEAAFVAFPVGIVVYLFSPFFGGYDEYDGGGRDWAAPLTFAVLGFLLVVLGLVLARRRGAAAGA